MLRSLFAGVSGLRAHQTKMDVTGNNISNVNTTGFKSQRTTFSDTLYQVARGGSAGQVNDPPDQEPPAVGGTNPKQIGLGADVAATDTSFSQGSLQLTDRATDAAIQGEGFFVVQDNGAEQYTRAGAFRFDSAGQFVGASGEIAKGWSSENQGSAEDPDYQAADDTDEGDEAASYGTIQIDPESLQQFSDISLNASGQIRGRDEDGEEQVLAQVATATFTNPGGLQREGSSLFGQTAASGEAEVGVAGTGGRGSIDSGVLEMSNVDLSQQFTQLIMAQRGFQANARTITTSDQMLQELVNLKR